MEAHRAVFGLWQEMLGRGEDPRGCVFVIANAAGDTLLEVGFDGAIGCVPGQAEPAASIPRLTAQENVARARRLAADLSMQVEQTSGRLCEIRAIVSGLNQVTVSRPPRASPDGPG